MQDDDKSHNTSWRVFTNESPIMCKGDHRQGRNVAEWDTCVQNRKERVLSLCGEATVPLERNFVLTVNFRRLNRYKHNGPPQVTSYEI